MDDSNVWTDINVGAITREEAKNIARELRRVWSGVSNVYPGGDRKKVAQLKVTLDSFKQYHFWLNEQALVCVLLFCKNIQDPSKQTTDPNYCPPEVPDFLRWDGPKDSTPELKP